MRRSILLLACVFLLLCSWHSPTGVSLRFKNETSQDFVKLTIHIVNKEYNFGPLKKGEKTKPIKVEKCYRYCYAIAITPTDTMVCQPIDYVGEKLQTEGKLMMKLQEFNNVEYKPGEKIWLHIEN